MGVLSHSPRRRGWLALAVAVGVLGCNAVLGIHELDGSAGAEASLRRDAGLDASDTGRPDTGAVDAGCGTIVVLVQSDFKPFPATQAVFAVLGGKADTLIADAGYSAEQKKSWYELTPALEPEAGTMIDASVSACLGAGEYALQYFDVTSNEGVPPPQLRQVGLSSNPIRVLVGAKTMLELAPTLSNNVPEAGSYNGGYEEWASWTYGPCADAGACPGTTTCYQGFCYDMEYDVRNCHTGGHGCEGTACCSGSCVDLGNDPQNCGTCGNGCTGSTSCVSSVCQ